MDPAPPPPSQPDAPSATPTAEPGDPAVGSVSNAPLVVLLGGTGRIGRRLVAMLAPLVASGRLHVRAAVRSAATREQAATRLASACALTLKPARDSGVSEQPLALPAGFDIVVANARDGAALREAYADAVAIVDLTADVDERADAIHARIAQTAAAVGAHYITPSLAWPADLPAMPAPVPAPLTGDATAEAATASPSASSLAQAFEQAGRHAVVAAGAFPGLAAWLARLLVAGADLAIDRVRAAWFEEGVPGWSSACATEFASAMRTRIQPPTLPVASALPDGDGQPGDGESPAPSQLDHVVPAAPASVRFDFGGVVGIESAWPVASIDRRSIAAAAPEAEIVLFRAGEPAAHVAESIARTRSAPSDASVGRKLAARFGRRPGWLAAVLGTALRTGGMLIVEARERCGDPRFASLRLAVEDTGALTAIGVWLALRSLVDSGEQAPQPDLKLASAAQAMIERWDAADATTTAPPPGLSTLGSWPIPSDLTAALELAHGHDLEIDLPAPKPASASASTPASTSASGPESVPAPSGVAVS